MWCAVRVRRMRHSMSVTSPQSVGIQTGAVAGMRSRRIGDSDVAGSLCVMAYFDRHVGDRMRDCTSCSERRMAAGVRMSRRTLGARILFAFRTVSLVMTGLCCWGFACDGWPADVMLQSALIRTISFASCDRLRWVDWLGVADFTGAGSDCVVRLIATDRVDLRRSVLGATEF